MKNGHINPTMLLVLVSLAETRSFSRTAEQMALTQSAVSHAMRGLEIAVGAQLAVRDRRGIVLTALGERAARSASEALSAMQELFHLSEDTVTGTVRLASVVTASTHIVPELLVRTRQRHPGLDVTLLVGTDEEVRGWVEDRIADIGLAYDTGSDVDEIVVEDQLLAVTAAHAPLAKKPGPVQLSDLDGLDFVMSAAGCGPLLDRMFRSHDVHPKIVTTVSDLGALLAIVAAGHGVSIVPGLALAGGRPDGLVVRPFEPVKVRPLRLKVCREASASSTAVIAALRSVSSRVGSDRRT